MHAININIDLNKYIYESTIKTFFDFPNLLNLILYEKVLDGQIVMFIRIIVLLNK